MRFPWTAAFAMVLGVVGSAQAGELNVGDPAPKLEVKEFVKGEPVACLEKGTVYVVEFWATWCPPCWATIPHLTELQKKYKDVVFIGVSIAERDSRGVKPFVEQMGDRMAYRVATDDVPGKMYKTWFQAAGQRGIPCAFIINKDTNIAWIGHPTRMEEPLAQVVAGIDNPEIEAKIKELQQELDSLQSAGQYGDAVRVAQKLDCLTGFKNPRIVGVLAKTYFAHGDFDKAVEAEDRLVQLVTRSSLDSKLLLDDLPEGDK
jgi:thiol-disulfide isomerase/thioredoxin